MSSSIFIGTSTALNRCTTVDLFVQTTEKNESDKSEQLSKREGLAATVKIFNTHIGRRTSSLSSVTTMIPVMDQEEDDWFEKPNKSFTLQAHESEVRSPASDESFTSLVVEPVVEPTNLLKLNTPLTDDAMKSSPKHNLSPLKLEQINYSAPAQLYRDQIHRVQSIQSPWPPPPPSSPYPNSDTFSPPLPSLPYRVDSELFLEPRSCTPPPYPNRDTFSPPSPLLPYRVDSEPLSQPSCTPPPPPSRQRSSSDQGLLYTSSRQESSSSTPTTPVVAEGEVADDWFKPKHFTFKTHESESSISDESATSLVVKPTNLSTESRISGFTDTIPIKYHIENNLSPSPSDRTESEISVSPPFIPLQGRETHNLQHFHFPTLYQPLLISMPPTPYRISSSNSLTSSVIPRSSQHVNIFYPCSSMQKSSNHPVTLHLKINSSFSRPITSVVNKNKLTHVIVRSRSLSSLESFTDKSESPVADESSKKRSVSFCMPTYRSFSIPPFVPSPPPSEGVILDRSPSPNPSPIYEFSSPTSSDASTSDMPSTHPLQPPSTEPSVHSIRNTSPNEDWLYSCCFGFKRV